MTAHKFLSKQLEVFYFINPELQPAIRSWVPGSPKVLALTEAFSVWGLRHGREKPQDSRHERDFISFTTGSSNTANHF